MFPALFNDYQSGVVFQIAVIPLIDRGNQIEAIQIICIYIGRFPVSNAFGHLFTHRLLSVALSIYT